MKRELLFIISLNFFTSFLHAQSNNAYLNEILSNIRKIKSVEYFVTATASAPGDTLSFSKPRTFYTKEYPDTSEQFAGAQYLLYNQGDTTKLFQLYNGSIEATFDWTKKVISVDNFQDNPHPIRLLRFPFFTRVGNIIEYALTSNDSISIHVMHQGDSSLFVLRVFDKVQEFLSKPFDNPFSDRPTLGKLSQYDIWIDNKTKLPFRMRRKMNHSTSFETCKEIKVNFDDQKIVVATDYFPADFKTVPFVRRKGERPVHPLEGKQAPDWTLKNFEGLPTQFARLKSKVLLIQFTGIGCGPCHESLPFLRAIVENYKGKSFEVIGIETWSNNIEGLKRYTERNQLNFKMFLTTPEVIKQYEIGPVPAFFVIDEKRIVRKVIMGYSFEKTNKEITDLINQLL